ACAAIAVLPPGRFSITTGCFQSSLILCPMMRALMSVGPPAGNGTMMRIGRVGKSRASCAAAGSARSMDARRRRVWRINELLRHGGEGREASRLDRGPTHTGGAPPPALVLGDAIAAGGLLGRGGGGGGAPRRY